MMTNDMGDTEKLAEYIAEAATLGIRILPPDVNGSDVHFAPEATGAGGGEPEAGAIRFGLAAIKGVGEVAMQSILDSRATGGRFTSLVDLCERVDTRALNRKVLEAFVRCGACDSLGASRAALSAEIDRALTRGQSVAQDRLRGQASMFGLLDAGAPETVSRSDVIHEWPVIERLAAEKELLGFYVTGHPLDPYRSVLETYALTDTARLSELPNRTMTRLGGIVSAVQQGFSKRSGKPYALLTLEDHKGSVQLLCLNEAYDRHRDLFTVARPIFVIGEVVTGEDRPKIFPQEIYPLEEAPRRLTRQVHLRFCAAETTVPDLQAARELVAAHPGPCPLFLCFQRADGMAAFVEANDRLNVMPSLEFQKAVQARLGDHAYYAKADPTLPERARRRWEAAGNGE